MDSKVSGIGRSLACILVLATLAPKQNAQGQESRAGSKVARSATKSADESSSPSPLLNVNEGLSVIGAALESRSSGLSGLDCSHLVHTLYERAGFPYVYASSSDLYAGVDEFQQVTHPHVGDLVVWSGHAGIVVNPEENTFFSALSSGNGVESYSSPYWKERGTPRFYRYTKVPAMDGIRRLADTPSLTPTPLAASVDSEPKLLIAAITESPRVEVIESAKPQTKEVARALLLSLSADPNALREADVFKLTRPLIICSQVEVEAVKIHGSQGRVQVQITALLSLDGGQVNPKKWQQMQSWPIRRRDHGSWELLLPQDAIYLLRETAVRVLAHQLSQLADADPTANLRQKSQLAKMLATILMD